MFKKKKDPYQAYKEQAYKAKEIKYDWKGKVKKDEVEKKELKYPPLKNGLSSNRPH